MIKDPGHVMRSSRRSWRAFRHYRIALLGDGGVYIVRPSTKPYCKIVIALIGPTLGM